MFLYYWYKYFSLFFFPLDTLEIASVNLPIPVQTRNYYKNVSDNKEIVKLVSVLSTIINSTKKVCQEDLQPGYFALQHRPVWCPALKLAFHVAWAHPLWLQWATYGILYVLSKCLTQDFSFQIARWKRTVFSVFLYCLLFNALNYLCTYIPLVQISLLKNLILLKAQVRLHFQKVSDAGTGLYHLK